MVSIEWLQINANLIFGSVVIPFLVMTLFTGIRKVLGNSVSAMADVLVFLTTVDLYFVVDSDPWIGFVHVIVRAFFRALFISLALVSVIAFLFGLHVERQIVRDRVRRSLPNAIHLLPPEVVRQTFPYFGVMGCWSVIGSIVALNALPFVLR